MMLLLLAVDALTQWRDGEKRSPPWMVGLWTALGALCRYEGWLFAAGVILILALDFWTGQTRRVQAAKSMASVAVCFALPVLVHFAYLYSRVGDSFVHRVARGNPAPYETFHRPFLSLAYHLGELGQIAAILPLLLGLAGLAWSLRPGGRAVRLAPLYLLWIPSLVNIAAFYWGMLYRVRYSILLVPAIAIFGSLLLVSPARAPQNLHARVRSCHGASLDLVVFPARMEIPPGLPGAGHFDCSGGGLDLPACVSSRGRVALAFSGPLSFRHAGTGAVRRGSADYFRDA